MWYHPLCVRSQSILFGSHAVASHSMSSQPEKLHTYSLHGIHTWMYAMSCHAMPWRIFPPLPFPSFPSAPSLTRPPSPHNISILSSALRLNNRLYLFLSSPLPHNNRLASPLTTVLGSNTGSSSSNASITARTCSPISSVLVLRGK